MSEEKQCPRMSRFIKGEGICFQPCIGDACAWWESMYDSCSVKAQQRHIRALSLSFTELGMALFDILKK